MVSVDKYRYYVTFVGDRTRFIWFYPLHNKSDFYSIFILFVKFVEKQFSSKIKCLQTYGGREFFSQRFRLHLVSLKEI